MFYSRRKRQKKLVEAEAAGESFWTEYLVDRTRGRLVHLIRSIGDSEAPSDARAAVLAEEGVFYLASGDLKPYDDALAAVLEADTDVVFSLVEGIAHELRNQIDRYQDTRQTIVYTKMLTLFSEGIHTILREERVAFDFVDGQIVPLSSLELHEEVVLPALTLLGGNLDFQSIEQAYRHALEEIHTGTPGDAITDAATALQETLTLLGCEGNALGPQIASAQKKGLLAAHDAKLLDWVSADRSQKGDAHKAEGDGLSRQDAWLTVHVVGALIVRLLADERR